MALIGTIRKNFWFVLVLLGMALAAFVIMDMTSAGGMGGRGAQMTIGNINGQKLNWNEFQITEQILYGNSGGDLYQRRDALWNYFVEKAIVEKESETLGLYVSSDELMDLQFGQNLSPIIRQNWTNPETGQIDMAQLLQFKQAIENNQAMEPRFRQFWAEQEKQIIKTQLEDKLKTLVAKALFTPTWMAEISYNEQNSSFDLAYVKLPYDLVEDSNINLTDKDFSQYLKDHAKQFTQEEETRQLDYAVLNVIPTAEDTGYWKTDIEKLIIEFEQTQDDSIYAINHNGFYANYYYKPEALSDSLKVIIPRLQENEVYGPIIENNSYRSVKLLETRMVPDSVKARHILKSATAGDLNQFAAARKIIDSLKTILESGQESFDSLAFKYSDDTQSKTIGGDLGYFEQGRMVPSFNNICFLTGKVGGIYTVETEYGIHLIKIDDQKYIDRNPKYKIAFINVPIIPTQDTQDRILEDASELISSHPYLDDLNNVITARDDISMESVSALKQNDYVFGTLGSGNTSRDIVRWAFDPSTSVNDVSPEVYMYTDPVRYFNSKYVVTGLKKIVKAGLPSIEDLREDIRILVQNQKKAEFLQSNTKSTELKGIAQEYDLLVDTVSNIAFNSAFVAGIGNEPSVFAKATILNENIVSEPIAGESGMFYIKVLQKSVAGEASNLPQIGSLETSNKRNQLNFQFLEALKSNAKIKDNRFTFY